MAKKATKKAAKPLYEITRDRLPVEGFVVRGMKIELAADEAKTFIANGWVKRV